MKYNSQKNAVCISVRELVEYNYLPADIDTSKPLPSLENAHLGSEIHKERQQTAGENYQAEVPFSFATTYQEIPLIINGRADGIIGGNCIEEIKTLPKTFWKKSPRENFYAQAKCYAYFLAKQNNLEKVFVQVNCIDPTTRENKIYQKEETINNLENFFYSLLEKIAFRLSFYYQKGKNLNSLANARFPYASLREGQEIFMAKCYGKITANKQLFASIPTGTGKTISALYPAIKALGKEKTNKIFYLTPKEALRKEAFHACADLYKKGTNLYAIALYSKESLCKNEIAKNSILPLSHFCNGETCPYAKDYYKKRDIAIEELLSNNHGITRKNILEIAEKYQICPHEFSLDISEFCDVIICDYNYFLDPSIHLHRYFDDATIKENHYTLLIDEAHNVIDRAISIFSATLSYETLIERANALVGTGAENTLYDLADIIKKQEIYCKDTITKDAEGNKIGFYVGKTSPLELIEKVEKSIETLSNTFLQEETSALCLYETLQDLKKFSRVAPYFDNHFALFINVENENVIVTLSCLDPSEILKQMWNKVTSCIFFSATLTPKDYFMDLLGASKTAEYLSLPSPFEEKNFCLMTLPYLSTRLEDRSKTAKLLVASIASVVSAKKGNYIVYFPSYAYLKQIFSAFVEKYPKLNAFAQKEGMTYHEKEEFLSHFTEQEETWRIGFCVLGGSFAEGVDLPGKQLIGAVIVGNGMPSLSSERNLLMEYYNSTRENGFAYAYTYPGFHRVLQAGGRVIRTPEDKGIVALIDDRYATPELLNLFPKHWKHPIKANTYEEAKELAKEFWNKNS